MDFYDGSFFKHGSSNHHIIIVMFNNRVCYEEFLVVYLNFAHLMPVFLPVFRPCCCSTCACIFTKMSPMKNKSHCIDAYILMLLLALYCIYCAPTPFLCTLHSSQVMLLHCYKMGSHLGTLVPMGNFLGPLSILD